MRESDSAGTDDTIFVVDTAEEALILWLANKPVHMWDDEHTKQVCCPDFSCCYPELAVDQDTRRTFAFVFNSGDTKTTAGMLKRFQDRYRELRLSRFPVQ